MRSASVSITQSFTRPPQTLPRCSRAVRLHLVQGSEGVGRACSRPADARPSRYAKARRAGIRRPAPRPTRPGVRPDPARHRPRARPSWAGTMTGITSIGPSAESRRLRRPGNETGISSEHLLQRRGAAAEHVAHRGIHRQDCVPDWLTTIIGRPNPVARVMPGHRLVIEPPEDPLPQPVGSRQLDRPARREHGLEGNLATVQPCLVAEHHRGGIGQKGRRWRGPWAGHAGRRTA